METVNFKYSHVHMYIVTIAQQLLYKNTKLNFISYRLKDLENKIILESESCKIIII